MANEINKRDENRITVLSAITDDASQEIRMLRVDPSTGRLKVSASGAGDVVGPASATDNAIVRFDGATGKLLQNSAVIIDDSNVITGGTWQGTAIDGTYIDLEGTELKSTGEGGGSKFLREDGDGTCSWQSVPGGGDALTSNGLDQFAATTSAELAGVISNETGSGLLVFNDSPALITPDLGTPSALVGTNITGTAAGLTVGATTGVEAGADVTDTANVTSAGALMDSELTSIADVKALDQSVVNGASPVFDGTNFTNIPAGTVDVVSNVATARVLGRITAGSGNSEELTATQVRTLINVEDNADVTDATNVQSAGALMDSELTSIADVKALNQSVVTTASPQFAGVNVGHATDTTISRSAAGVIAVESVVIPSVSSTNTITNKRNQPRTASSTTSSTLTPDLSSANVYYRTTQTATLTIGAPIGTPVIGETIAIYVDSAGAETLTINATYKAFGAAFPATSTAGKTFMLVAQYNGTDWKSTWSNAV